VPARIPVVEKRPTYLNRSYRQVINHPDSSIAKPVSMHAVQPCRKRFTRPLRRNPYRNPKTANCLGARFRRTHLVKQDYHQAVGAVLNGTLFWAQGQAVLSPGQEREPVRLLSHDHRSTRIEFAGTVGSVPDSLRLDASVKITEARNGELLGR
jgi:hypothetical protein